MKSNFTTMKWANVATMMENMGEDVDWDDESFICPICEEPILADDYPEISAEIDDNDKFRHPFCPICGSFFED